MSKSMAQAKNRRPSPSVARPKGPSAESRNRSAGAAGVPASVASQSPVAAESPSAISATAKGTRKRAQ